MFFGYFAYQMPLWACIVVALFPPMIVAVVVRVFARPGSTDEADSAKVDRLGRVIAILSTAFVFTVTFSTTNVWSQDSSIYDAANQMTQTSLAITQEIAYAVPEEATAADQQLEALMTAFPYDVNEVSIKASEQSVAQMREFHQWASSVSLPPDERTYVDARLTDLDREWRHWLTTLNAPGIPDVMWLLITLLGLMLVGAVALLPHGADPRHETTLLFTFAFIVGVMQVPLWVLDSMGFADVLVDAVFGEFANTTPAVDRFAFGLILIAVIGAGFFLILRLVGRFKGKNIDPKTNTITS